MSPNQGSLEELLLPAPLLWPLSRFCWPSCERGEDDYLGIALKNSLMKKESLEREKVVVEFKNKKKEHVRE